MAEDMEGNDALSDISDIASQTAEDTNLYTLQEVNDFLHETSGKTVDVSSFFSLNMRLL